MNPITHLARFVRMNDNPDDVAQVRAYVLEHAKDLAPAFGKSVRALRDACDAVDDDFKLARAIAAECKRANETARTSKTEGRLSDAQASADEIAKFATYDGYGRFTVDLASILASCLTTADDQLAFNGLTAKRPYHRADSDGVVCIAMGQLLALRATLLDRAPSVRAWLDENGLHVRYEGAAGRGAGFNLYAQAPLPISCRVTFHLPSTVVAFDATKAPTSVHVAAIAKSYETAHILVANANATPAAPATATPVAKVRTKKAPRGAKPASTLQSPDGIRKAASLPCPMCGRPRSECFRMPCLELEQVLAQGKSAVRAWMFQGVA